MTTTVDTSALFNNAISGGATTSAAGSASAAATKKAAGGASETENRFLTLLVAQMKNQDPLNPMDNSQVTSQMAQLSTVNGIEKLNASMATMATGFTGLQTVQTASLAGRQVMADGNAMVLANGSASGGFNLQLPVDDLTVTILDSAGAIVQKVDMGAQPAGVQVFQWDGKTDSGADAAPGRYTFKVTAREGVNTVAVETLTVGSVQAIRPAADGAKLSVSGIGEIGLADIKKIF